MERILALGAAEPLAKYGSLANLFERSELFAIMIWPGAKQPPTGPRPGRSGFGSFCRNKRTSPAGARPGNSFK